METINYQYNRIKNLQKDINASIKEFKAESAKYELLISNAFTPQLKDLKVAIETQYGDVVNIREIPFGFSVSYVKGVTRDEYGDEYLPSGSKGLGTVQYDIKLILQNLCTLSQGVKITDVEWSHIAGSAGYGWSEDTVGIIVMNVLLTKKYMDSVNKTKRIPQILY